MSTGKEQAAEVNRIREALIEGLLTLKEEVHPREAALALISMANEAHQRGTHFDKETIRDILKNMVDHILDHTVVTKRKDIQ